jgi:hypothetical protein
VPWKPFDYRPYDEKLKDEEVVPAPVYAAVMHHDGQTEDQRTFKNKRQAQRFLDGLKPACIQASSGSKLVIEERTAA